MDYSRKMVHTINIIPSTVGGWGATTLADTICGSVTCYITGARKRILDDAGEEHEADFAVYITTGNTYGLGFAVQEGKNEDGITLINSGTIIAVYPRSKPRSGMQFIQCMIKTGK